MHAERTGPGLRLRQLYSTLSQVSARPEVGKWKGPGTFGPRSAPGVGLVPGPGEWQQLTVSRNGGGRKAELTHRQDAAQRAAGRSLSSCQRKLAPRGRGSQRP